MITIKNNLGKFGLLILLIIFSEFSTAQTWTQVNGVNSYVNKILFIEKDPNKILVCSDNVPTDFRQAHIEFPNYGFGNLGYQYSTDGGNSFGPKVLNGYSVYDIMPLSKAPNVWLASIRKGTRGGIIASTDAGANWNTETKGCDESWQILSLLEDNQNNITYGAAVGTGEGFRYTNDNYTTCNHFKNIDISTRGASISKDGNIIYVGGDDTYGNGVFHSTNNGESWIKDSTGLKNLRVLCVYPSKYDNRVVFAGCDSLDSYRESTGKGIYQSLDSGKTWKLIGAKDARIFQIVEHPTNPKYLAAAGDSTGVWISGSYGWEWENYSAGLPIINSPIRNVAISPENPNASGFIVFAGTYGGGLYKSQRIITDVNDNIDITLSVFPNPSENIIAIQTNKLNTKIIEISNYLGLKESNFTYIIKSNNLIEINIQELKSGIYFINIDGRTIKFIKL